MCISLNVYRIVCARILRACDADITQTQKLLAKKSSYMDRTIQTANVVIPVLVVETLTYVMGVFDKNRLKIYIWAHFGTAYKM